MRAYSPCGSSKRGSALLIVLAFVVLLTGLIVAFFFRTISDRKVAHNSANSVITESLARGALDVVIGDLKQEIRDQSNVKTSADVSIYLPKTASDILPQRETSGLPDPLPNMVRRSVRNDPLSVKSGAVAAGSDTPTREGRSISKLRWNAPYLLPRASSADATPVAAFVAPDWVMVTRSGAKSAATPMQMGNSNPTNQDFAIGRYAYTIYDEGGLLNLNVAGVPATGLTALQVGRKGSTAFADLTALKSTSGGPPLLTSYDIDKLVAWRNAATLNASGTFGAAPVFGSATDTDDFFDYITKNRNGFQKVGFFRTISDESTNSAKTANGRTDQALLSRRDLIKLWESLGLNKDALQFMGTFSRDANAPSWMPAPKTSAGTDIGSYKVNAETPTAANRNISNVRVNAPFTRFDGSQAVVGEPLIKQRFPLSWLALVSHGAPASADVQRIKNYFGLTFSESGKWTYNHGSPDAIYSLDQVAAANREPDFFELLKAGILSDSVGKSAGRTLAMSDIPDTNRDNQIIRIGANIIDQADGDSYPTAINFFGYNFYGIENLPYLSEVFVKPVREKNEEASPISVYFVCELWNPHDAAFSSSPTALSAGDNTRIASDRAKIPPRIRVRVPYGVTSYDDSLYSPMDTIEIPQASYSQFVQPSLPTSNPVPLLNVSAIKIRTAPLKDAYYSWSFFYIPTETMLITEYQDVDGAWKPYSTFTGLIQNDPTQTTATGLQEDLGNPKARDVYGNQVASNVSIPFPVALYQSEKEEDFTYDGDTSWAAMVPPQVPQDKWPRAWRLSITKSDPRTPRFGASVSGRRRGSSTPDVSDDALDGRRNTSDRPSSLTNGFPTFYSKPNWNVGDSVYYPGTLAQNSSGSSDRDGIKRAADGQVAAPTNPLFDPAKGPSASDSVSRQIILNRPFRSVGELGYVFRDEPWKTLNFCTAPSGDSGLLDLFSVEESAVTSSRVSLNTRNSAVLESIIRGSLKTDSGGQVSDAKAIADGLLSYRGSQSGSNWAFSNSADLPAAISSLVITDSVENNVKTQREAAVRALSDTTSTRTWNLLIDLVAQSGRFPTNATDLSRDFIVQGERRYWLHVAIDRYTGKVIDQQLEVVYE